MRILNVDLPWIQTEPSAPTMLYGNGAPDGDADPFVDAPLGSLYVRTLSGDVRVYQKEADDEDDNDWTLLQPGGNVATYFKRIPLTAATHGTGSEVDTGYDLPANSILLDALVHVTTQEATASTKTLNVGLLSTESGGDADGFLDGISVAAAGIVRGVATLTTGSSEVFFASDTKGALLATLVAGTDAATDVGTYYEKPHIAGAVTAKSVSVTSAEAFTEFAGDLYLHLVEVMD